MNSTRQQCKKTILILSLILLFGATSRIVWAEWESDNDESSRMKKTACSKFGVKKFSPQTRFVGQKMAIRGRGFGKDPGEVIFNKNVPAKIISWSNRRIWVLVPEGAITGNVKVIKTCPSGKFEVSQHIKIVKPTSE